MVYIVLVVMILMGLWYGIREQDKLKAEAEKFRKVGKKTFRDRYGVERSTETLEEVKVIFDSSFHNFHSVIVGKDTRKVYRDLTEERVQKVNEDLKQRGKKYILKDGKYLTDSVHPTYFQYDPESGKYVQCLYFGKNRMKRYYSVSFGNYVNGRFVEDENMETLFLDEEEGKAWYYSETSRQVY